MAKQMGNSNRGGRPKSYAPELVQTIIAESIRGGMPIANIDASFVKEQMCKHHGVSEQIRIEGLKDLVAVMLKEFAEEERRTLMMGLPDAVAPAVEEVVAAAGRELLLLLAREHAICKAAAEQESKELRADKRIANWRVADLEAALKEQEGVNRKIVRQRDEATAQLTNVREQLRVAHAEVERLERECGTVGRLLTELRNPAVREDIRAALTDIVAPPASESRAS